jgi:hypothetical protein
VAEKAITAFHKVGQYFMDRFQERMRPWKILPKEKGECFSCGAEKNLTMEKEGQKYCSPCGKAYLAGGQFSLS